MKSINALTGFVAIIALMSMASVGMAGSYVAGFGGLNWDNVGKGLTSDTGYVMGGAFGSDVPSIKGLKAEVELAFRSSDVSIPWGLSAKHETTTIMGNLVYDVDLGSEYIRPFLVGGIGYGVNKGIIENLSVASLESAGFSWQVGAGLSTPLVEGVDASIEYRYLTTPEIQAFGYQAAGGDNSSVLIGISMRLN